MTVPCEGMKNFQAWINAPGSAEMMLTVMMMDVPLPIPFSVIWSAIHSSSTVPATMVMTVRVIQMKDGSGMGDGSPEGAHTAPSGRAYSMNFVGSTYVTGFMIANGYFGSFTVLP